MTRTWTDEQRELIEIDSGGGSLLPRVAVSADAGAGKTSVLVERVRRLPPASRVLCVSFTEKSKADLEQRLADRPGAEVYTIHGFCGRVVSEFGARVGLPPFLRIMDADEREEIFYECFEKVYRRSPPASTDRGADAIWSVCRAAAEERGAQVRDLSGGDLPRFVGEVLAELEAAKRRARGVEYSDLEVFALELLRRPEVRALVRSRFDQVFVDEFQDTTRTQCELVNLLTGTALPIFVVGDTKQSIYRFRGAEVDVFREFVAGLPAHRRLSANFRSHEAVIEAANAVCMPIIDGYGPMTAGRAADHFEAAVFDGGGMPRVARVTCETDAEGIAALVHALAARGVERSQIVLLLRKIRGAEKLFRELAARGVTVAIASSGSARFSVELASLLNLWIWSCEPWQKLRGAQVLAELGGSSRERPRERLDAELAALSAEWVAGLRGVTTCEGQLRALDARFGLSARFGAIFSQFGTFILRHQSEGLSPAALARRLHHMLANGLDIPGFSLLSPPVDLGGSIRVLTIHSAKGLEFPVVILGEVGRHFKSNLGFMRAGLDVWVPGRDEDGAIDWASSPEAVEAKARDAQAETAERARLLYVAMTRAQEALYVVDRPEPQPDPDAKPKKPSKKAPDTSWGAWLKAGLAVSRPVEHVASTEVADVSAGERVAAPAAPSRAADPGPLEPEPPVYRRARAGVSQLTAGEGGDEPGAESVQPRAHRGRGQDTPRIEDDPRTLGIAIHRCFELGDWDELRRRADRNRLDLSAFWRWMETETARRVFEAGQQNRFYNELAFEWKQTDGSVLAGRIDRLVIVGDEAWVIDYKILLARRPAADVLADYGPQLGVYAEAVGRLTGLKCVRAFILDVTAASGGVWLEVTP